MIDNTLEENTLETLGAMEYAPKYHNWILDEFKPFIGKNIVEVGSGTGSITKKLFEFSIDKLYSLEPAEQVFESLKSNIKKHQSQAVSSSIPYEAINSYLSESAEYLKDKKIDTFLYINVLEHVEKDLDELKHIYDVLEENGRILIFVPALQWLYGSHDKNVGHYRRYYKKELKSKVEEAGFKIEKLKYFDFAGILPWWFTFKVLRIKHLKDGQSQIYDKLIVPIERIIETRIPPFIGKNLLLVAKKQE
jgi:SAM-dependent methyltransferase